MSLLQALKRIIFNLVQKLSEDFMELLQEGNANELRTIMTALLSEKAAVA